MKYFYTLAALVALVAAQEIPACAIPCIQEATESATDCTFGDRACTCEPDNKTAVTNAATSCVIAACGVDVAINEVRPATDALCANLPEEPATTSTPAAETTPAEPETPASSAPAAESSAEEESTAAPTYAAPPAESTSETYPVPSGNGTAPPQPTESHVEAGAAKAGFMGAAALAGLVALAL